MIFFPVGHNGTRNIGPFVDATDGYTRETGLTIPYTSVLCAGQGGSFSALFTEPGNLSSYGNGYYGLYIDFGELPFCGVFDLVVDITGARPYSDKIIVIPLELYSYLFFGNPFTFGELVTFSQGIAGNITGNLSGSIGSLDAQAKSDVNAELKDVLETDTQAEPTSPPASTASIRDKIAWLFALGKNKRIQTSTAETVFADNGTTPIATSNKSDTGGTFTRGKYQ